MLGIKNYLEEGPKSWLAKLHKKHQKIKGLVQGSKVLSDMESWALDEERLSQSLEELTEIESGLLGEIYFSEERGVLESDLYSNSRERDPAQLSQQLHSLEEKMLIYSRKGDNYSFHGFRELFIPVLEQTLPKNAGFGIKAEGLFSHQNFTIPHLIHFMASAYLGRLKCTQKGELNRRSILMLRDNFTASQNISPQISQLELDMYFQFCLDKQFLLDGGDRLFLSKEGLEYCSLEYQEINQSLVEWWLRRRMCNSRKIFEILESQYPEGTLLTDLAALWKCYSPLKTATVAYGTKEGFSWENLPDVLKELYVLGGVEFQLQRAKIHLAKFNTQFLKEHVAPQTEESLSYSLPNFEVLLSNEAPPHRRFQLESLAQKQNDEAMCSYRLSKESVVEGLKSGISEEVFLELMDWLGFNDQTRESLKEWSASYTSSEFQELLVLRIKDKEKWKLLSQLPPFLKLTEEAIEGYGFVINPFRKDEVQSFLSQFGLSPGDPQRKETQTGLIKIKPENPRSFSSDFSRGEIQFHSNEKGRFFNRQQSPSKKYSSQSKSASNINFSRMVEYAIVTDKKVEISIINGDIRRILIRPLRIIHEDSQPKIIGTEVQSGMRSEYSLEDISSLRVIE